VVVALSLKKVATFVIILENIPDKDLLHAPSAEKLSLRAAI
jgi:hypothetical protein